MSLFKSSCIVKISKTIHIINKKINNKTSSHKVKLLSKNISNVVCFQRPNSPSNHNSPMTQNTKQQTKS